MKTTLKYTLAATTVAVLAACGGGGTESSVSNPLSKYEGVFYSCEDNDKTTITLTAKGSDSLSITAVEIIYSGDKCSGNILATYRLLAPLVVKYKGQTTATMPTITLLPFSDKVDEVSISTAGVAAELTGSGVVGNCVKYSYKTDSGSTEGEDCFELNIPAESISGALYLTADSQSIVQFSRENGVLTADSISSKNPNFNYDQLVRD